MKKCFGAAFVMAAVIIGFSGVAGASEGISGTTGAGTGEHISGAARLTTGYNEYVIDFIGIDFDGDGVVTMREHAQYDVTNF